MTAEDDSTTKTYTVTVTRLVTSQQNQASSDATLSSLTLSGIDFGTFSSDTDSYTASVAYGVSQTTVTPTVNDSGATHVIKLGGATDADGTVSLGVASNVITVEVTAEDDSTTRTYTVTVTRAAPSPPLTATVHDNPSSHDGNNSFTFELRFSENMESFSYSTLQNHSLTVTGGTLPKVRRLEAGKNVRWEITVQPSSNADVTVVLPITTDCAVQGAICTGNGRKLSSRVELTISGPSG